MEPQEPPIPITPDPGDGPCHVGLSRDSILAAAEHFLGKSRGDIQNIVRPVLEKHLRAILGNSSLEVAGQDPGVCADRVQAAASADLGSMGLSVISFTIQAVHAK